jgi:hypothetical protein
MIAENYEIFRVKSIVTCCRLVREKLEMAWDMRDNSGCCSDCSSGDLKGRPSKHNVERRSVSPCAVKG